MKREINRCTLNLINARNVVPFAESTFENIDRLSTNFNGKPELISFLKSQVMINDVFDDINITYYADEHLREAPLIFNNMRNIVDKKGLINDIILYLSKYSNLCNLETGNLHNSYLQKLLYEILEQKDVKAANFRLEKLRQHLTNEYKLKRDLAIFLDSQFKKRGKNSFIYTDGRFGDMEAINKSLSNMNVIAHTLDHTNEEEHKFFDYLETNDEYLNYLMARRDYETIANTYDLDTLEALGIREIVFGNHDDDKGIAKTKH
jgi:hypothetical protein